MNVHTTQSLKRQLRFKIAQRWWRSYSSLRKGQWHYQWRLAEVCCLLVENYSNSCQVWSSRSFLQFLCGLRPNACRCFRREDRNVYTLIRLGGGTGFDWNHEFYQGNIIESASWGTSILCEKWQWINNDALVKNTSPQETILRMTMNTWKGACQEHKNTRHNLAFIWKNKGRTQ